MNKEAAPLVSVIVPIYNTHEFLPRCLDSILNQSYINMEIVLVNDGSTDESLSICEKYAGKDGRIHIVSQSNQGIIMAKRAGIKLCHGEYVMFVDSDDWIEPELLEAMVRAIRESGCLLVSTDVYKDFEDRTVEMRNYIPAGIYETGTITKDLFYYKDTEEYGILPYSVAKLYSRDMLEEVLNYVNSDIRYAEDKAIVFSIVFQNIKICFTDDIYYHYCVRKGSVCYSGNHDYLIELTIAYKYIKKIFDGQKEWEHLLWQLGKWMWIEARGAIHNQLGLIAPGKSIYREPYRLDPSVFLGQKKKVILYGAGKVGADYHKQIIYYMNVELCAWVDKNHEKCRENGFDVQPVEHIRNSEYDYILVAVNNENVFFEIKEELTGMGVTEDKIIWGKPLQGASHAKVEDAAKKIIAESRKLPIKKNKVLFSNYDGKGYGGNCKYIAEEFIRGRYPVQLVWAVSDNGIQGVPEQIKKVLIGTPQYYRELFTSGIYVTNTVHNLYEQKRKGQFYINTWHGYGPFKLAEGAVNKDAASRERYSKSNAASDLFLTASRFYTQVYRDSFFYEGEVMECGAPRNDVFFADNGIKASVYEKLEIPSGKKILLYAPTFREDTANSFQKYDIDMGHLLGALGRRFGGEYILMYRFHHCLYAAGMPQDFYAGAIDATYYPDVQELLVAADVVITDYSSLMWDFSLQRRPVFLYQNDECEYMNDRGFYAPVSEWPYPKAHTQDELADAIINFDNDGYIKKLNAFFEKYGSCDDGHAAKRVVDRILRVINENT